MGLGLAVRAKVTNSCFSPRRKKNIFTPIKVYTKTFMIYDELEVYHPQHYGQVQ